MLEATEAVGLWLIGRWAECLTLVATAVLLIPEWYELALRPAGRAPAANPRG